MRTRRSQRGLATRTLPPPPTCPAPARGCVSTGDGRSARGGSAGVEPGSVQRASSSPPPDSTWMLRADAPRTLHTPAGSTNHVSTAHRIAQGQHERGSATRSSDC
eukprot:687766-Rhodomonas_salina.2